MKNTRGPKPENRTRKINAGIGLDSDLISELDRIAKDQGISRSRLVELVLRNWLKMDAPYNDLDLELMRQGKLE